jgi:hypothetical protein
MLRVVHALDRFGPARFFKIAGIWILLVGVTALVSLAVGRSLDLVRFGVGALVLFAPVILVTVVGWARGQYAFIPSFVQSTLTFLCPAYEGMKWYWDAEIWLGRVCIVLGFVVSLLGLLSLP